MTNKKDVTEKMRKEIRDIVYYACEDGVDDEAVTDMIMKVVEENHVADAMARGYGDGCREEQRRMEGVRKAVWQDGFDEGYAARKRDEEEL